MAELWVVVLAAMLAGAVGGTAAFLLVARGWRTGRPEDAGRGVSPPPSSGPVRDDPGQTPPPDALPSARPPGDPRSGQPAKPDLWWHQMWRCEHAVCRAARAVDAVSSARARERLHAVVRRMDAELPNVRALVELGRGLDAGEGAQNWDATTRRVHEQLDAAACRFGLITDHVSATVLDLVSAPDLSRMNREITLLRKQFPLLQPMSVVLGPGVLTSSREPVSEVSTA